jgi:endonuclease YncB( thermonuclease family)
MPMARLLALILPLLLLAACGQRGLDQLKRGEVARVAEVRSGDTVVLADDQIVRLSGVDAPNAGEPYAEESREALKRLVKDQ